MASFLPDQIEDAGFTFLEFIVVIALFAAVYVVAVPNLSITRTAEIDQKVGRLAVDFKSAYDMAVLTGKPHRLVFKFVTGQYWLEAAETRDFTFDLDEKGEDLSPEREKETLLAFDENFQEFEDLAGSEIEDSDNERVFTPESPVVKAKDKLRPPEWKRLENREWGVRFLGPELMLMDLEAEHHLFPIKLDITDEDQVGMIYFFPSGYVERAVIHFGLQDGDLERDESQPPYTAITVSHQGTLSITSGYEEVDIHDERQNK